MRQIYLPKVCLVTDACQPQSQDADLQEDLGSADECFKRETTMYTHVCTSKQHVFVLIYIYIHINIHTHVCTSKQHLVSSFTFFSGCGTAGFTCSTSGTSKQAPSPKIAFKNWASPSMPLDFGACGCGTFLVRFEWQTRLTIGTYLRCSIKTDQNIFQ